MRIGIDARMYGPEQAGLGRYIEQLIRHLEKIDSYNQYVIFLKRDNWDLYRPSMDNFKKVLADVNWYSWREQWQMHKIINTQKLDLMHFPHWNIPYFYKGPFVVTIHDLIMFHYPRLKATTLGPLKYFFKNKAHRLLVKRAVRRAGKIITVSRFSKMDIIKTLGVDSEKIAVVYPAPAPLIPADQAVHVDDKKAAPAINGDYVVYVGSAYPHKNLSGLLEAWKIFEQNYGSSYGLVLCGKDSFFYAELMRRAGELNLANVVWLGFVSDEQLVNLYTNASLFVFPSFYEGFGLPPLEALGFRVPVAASCASCLPEVLQEAAVYFDPENYRQMAEVIYKSLNDQQLRRQIRHNAIFELRRFDWRAAAKRTLDIYNNAVKKKE